MVQRVPGTSSIDDDTRERERERERNRDSTIQGWTSLSLVIKRSRARYRLLLVELTPLGLCCERASPVVFLSVICGI